MCFVQILVTILFGGNDYIKVPGYKLTKASKEIRSKVPKAWLDGTILKSAEEIAVSVWSCGTVLQ
jgi:hypothetical protein